MVRQLAANRQMIHEMALCLNTWICERYRARCDAAIRLKPAVNSMSLTNAMFPAMIRTLPAAAVAAILLLGKCRLMYPGCW